MSRMLAKGVWPASASARAVSAPKPLEAPVMRMFLLDIGSLRIRGIGVNGRGRVAGGWRGGAAVGVEDLAVHPAGGSGEERDSGGDVLGGSEALERRHAGEFGD